MKSGIVLLFCLASLVCQAQSDYEVTWKFQGCSSSISKQSRSADRTYKQEEVEPQKSVTLTIEIAKTNFKELRYSIKNDSGSEKRILTKDQIRFTDRNEAAAEISIAALSATENKMQIEGEPGELAYPYHFKVFNNQGDSCELILGDAKLLGEQSPETATQKSQINALEGIDVTASKDLPSPKYCENMESWNALIVIDASSGPFSRSRVYKKPKKGDCSATGFDNRNLKVGDYVKIYLENFNPYRYGAIVTSQQVDAVFGKALNPLPEPKSAPGDPDQPQAQGSESQQMAPKEKILNYAKAVDQLKLYIEFVKNNTMPDSRVLEFNKFTILKNLSRLNLIGSDIGETYGSLGENDKKGLEEAYKQAQLFNQTKNELMSLTYTVETTVLPIKIRSFDKFEFTVTAKDNASGKESFSRVYEYLIQGGLKVDQSFGVVFHGIRDQEFGLRSFIGRDTIYARNSNGEVIRKTNSDGGIRDSIASIMDTPKREIIEEGSPGKISFGASTLTHLYWRTAIGNRIRVGVGPELGISADVYPVTNLRYLFGLGALFYDGRHRISIDLGCAFGKFKAFGNGQDFGTILTGTDAQPTLIDRYGRSFYGGISFNTPLVRNDTQKQ